MSDPADTVVLLFAGTSHVMRAEKLLTQAGVRCRLIPVPRHISATCGVCVRVERADLDKATAAVRNRGLEPLATHQG